MLLSVYFYFYMGDFMHISEKIQEYHNEHVVVTTTNESKELEEKVNTIFENDVTSNDSNSNTTKKLVGSEKEVILENHTYDLKTKDEKTSETEEIYHNVLLEKKEDIENKKQQESISEFLQNDDDSKLKESLNGIPDKNQEAVKETLTDAKELKKLFIDKEEIKNKLIEIDKKLEFSQELTKESIDLLENDKKTLSEKLINLEEIIFNKTEILIQKVSSLVEISTEVKSTVVDVLKIATKGIDVELLQFSMKGPENLHLLTNNEVFETIADHIPLLNIVTGVARLVGHGFAFKKLFSVSEKNEELTKRIDVLVNQDNIQKQKKNIVLLKKEIEYIEKKSDLLLKKITTFNEDKSENKEMPKDVKEFYEFSSRSNIDFDKASPEKKKEVLASFIKERPEYVNAKIVNSYKTEIFKLIGNKHKLEQKFISEKKVENGLEMSGTLADTGLKIASIGITSIPVLSQIPPPSLFMHIGILGYKIFAPTTMGKIYKPIVTKNAPGLLEKWPVLSSVLSVVSSSSTNYLSNEYNTKMRVLYELQDLLEFSKLIDENTNKRVEKYSKEALHYEDAFKKKFKRYPAEVQTQIKNQIKDGKKISDLNLSEDMLKSLKEYEKLSKLASIHLSTTTLFDTIDEAFAGSDVEELVDQDIVEIFKIHGKLKEFCGLSTDKYMEMIKTMEVVKFDFQQTEEGNEKRA